MPFISANAAVTGDEGVDLWRPNTLTNYIMSTPVKRVNSRRTLTV